MLSSFGGCHVLSDGGPSMLFHHWWQLRVCSVHLMAVMCCQMADQACYSTTGDSLEYAQFIWWLSCAVRWRTRHSSPPLLKVKSSMAKSPPEENLLPLIVVSITQLTGCYFPPSIGAASAENRPCNLRHARQPSDSVVLSDVVLGMPVHHWWQRCAVKMAVLVCQQNEYKIWLPGTDLQHKLGPPVERVLIIIVIIII